MKKLYSLLILVIITGGLHAQDIPLFSQKMTNSFMYNPAVAGHSHGSLTYAFRKSFSGLQNAPRTNFISVHTPLLNHRFGVGANVFQEEVSFLRNTYASAAFAYHVKFSESSVLSMGVSGEYNSIGLNGRTNSDVEDADYIKLANGDLKDMDFSFGMMYHNTYLKIGLAANRLATGWLKPEDQFILSNFYSGFVQGMIPLRGGEDMLEPYVAFRKFSETNSMYDIGLFYTYNDMIIAGAAFRQGSVANATLGIRLNKKLQLGYSHEIFLGDIRSMVGSTNEITLRFDFAEYSYKTNFKADYKSAVAYRKKTMSTLPAPRSPGQFHKQQKKFVKYSPNKRYQAPTPVIKSQAKRHKAYKKYVKKKGKGFSAKRKPSYSKKRRR